MSTSFSRIPEITVGNLWSTAGMHAPRCGDRSDTAKKWLETALGDLEKRGAETEVEQEADS